ncbi:MAG: amidase [Actinoallomurus sp.]|jgi:Asp-tRNA(Asn)/Glu-tRNA(Gln) amidotransferase A subunit family amidase|nr:amidase [Actinoallomurus sp.]
MTAAGAIASAVAARRVRAVDVARAAIERIERLDPVLNAVVAMRADAAMEEAERLDRALADGAPAGPLAGVPVLVKDLEDVAGMRTTKGSALLAESGPAKRDGLMPSRLRAAGAIVIGKTNLPEFATEGYTANLLFGATGNPWAPEWSPGGSSGGSAAALAAGLVPVATATDGGGSIRIPAALCGLVGIKPTRGLIGRRPIPDWIDLSTDGPFATSVQDLRLLLRVEAGPVAGDPDSVPYALTAPPRRPEVLLAAERTSDLGPLPVAVAHAFDAAITALADVLALPVRRLDPSDIFTGGDPDLDWFTLAAPEHVSALGRAWVHDGLDRMHPAAAEFLRGGLDVGIDDYLAARRRRYRYVDRLDTLLGTSTVLLTPTVAAEGWLADGRLTADQPVGMLPPSVYSTAVQNMTGHPAITLPAGVYPNGLPFGLQVTGPRFSEGMLLDIADRWQQANPWPRTAPGYSPFETLIS